MTIKPIRNDDDLKKEFRRLEKIFQAEEVTAQADERDVPVTLVEACENKHYHFGPAGPVEAMQFGVEQEGLTPRDLEPFIGPSGRVSEVLNRKRPLRLRMVKRLRDGQLTAVTAESIADLATRTDQGSPRAQPDAESVGRQAGGGRAASPALRSYAVQGRVS
jgi:HTH-type transcriptional regulator/antitoxin HigA